MAPPSAAAVALAAPAAVARAQQLRRAPALLAPPRPRHTSRRRPARPTAAAPVTAAQKKVFKSFQDMITDSPEPVLVEFYATWCGPCQMMGNILDEVAPAMRGSVRFIKVDSEKYPTVAGQYHIGALPTLILFKQGQPVDRIEGVVMGQDLKNRLQYLLAKLK